MMVGERVLGVMAVQNYNKPYAYDEHDRQLLAAIASQTAIAIQNARLYAQARQHAQRQEALYRISTDLANLKDERKLCQAVVRACGDLLGYPYLGIFLVDRETSDRVLYAQSGWDAAPENWRLHPGEGLSELPILSGKLEYCPDITRNPRYIVGLGDSRSEVDLPIKIGGSVFGVMVVEAPRVDAFDQGDFDVLQAVANQLAVALENARLFAQVQQELAERKQAEEALAKERNLLRTLIDNLPDLVYVKDAEGRYALSNPAHVAFLGHSLPAEVIGKTIFDFFTPEKAREFHADDEKVLQSGQPLINREEQTIDRKTSQPRWNLTTKVPIRDSQGSVIGLVGVGRNITERKRAEEAEREQRVLAEALRDAAAALNATLDSDEVLDRILANIDRVVPIDAARVYLLEGDTLHVARARGYAERGLESFIATHRLTLSKTADLLQIMQTKQPIVISDTLTFPGWVAFPETQWIRSAITVPIHIKDQIIGFINLDSAVPGFFTPAHAERALSFADQVALALENARLFASAQQELAERKRAEEEAIRRSEELGALNQIGQSLNRLAEPSEMLELITTMIGKVMDTRNLYIALYDSVANIVSFPVYFIKGERRVNVMGRPFGNGLTEQVIRSKSPVLITNDMQEELLRRGIATVGTPARCYLAVPMLVGDKIMGVIAVQDYEKENVFQVNHLTLLSTIATQAAIALENARLFAALQVQATRLQIAAEVARTVTSILDIEQVLPRVTDLIREQFGYYHTGVFLTDGKNEWAVLSASSSETVGHELQGVMRLRVGREGMIGFVAGTGQTRVAQDVTADSAYVSDRHLPDTRAEAAVPLRIGDSVIGVLDVQSKHVNAFPSDAVAILATIADQIAIAIQNARLHSAEKQRAQELEQAYHTLQANQAQLLISEKMASLGRLTAGIAHEMNTPLAAVRAALAEIDKLINEYQTSIGDADVTPDDHRGIAQEMAQSVRLAGSAAERAAGFVRGIKTQTRDLAAHESQTFNAVPMIRETLLLLGHTLRAGKCKVEFEPAVEKVELDGSPGRLAQVITNLITNAVDACAAKGGGTISVRLIARATEVELQVSDTGSGIPPEIMPKIFDPMFTTKPFGQGTGLGLAIVHDIVTGEFGGTIQVTSEIDQGATFTLHFLKSKEK
jgi:PAS domain S-box-containing protein